MSCFGRPKLAQHAACSVDSAPTPGLVRGFCRLLPTSTHASSAHVLIVVTQLQLQQLTPPLCMGAGACTGPLAAHSSGVASLSAVPASLAAGACSSARLNAPPETQRHRGCTASAGNKQHAQGSRGGAAPVGDAGAWDLHVVQATTGLRAFVGSQPGRQSCWRHSCWEGAPAGVADPSPVQL